MAARSSRPELIVIVGETASGKSELAQRAAEELDGEVINADSWAVYRGFDVGTSKPSKPQQTRARNHLIDVVDAKDGFNAALFKKLAAKAITDIQKRGKTPILAGGTGLYIDSVLFDYGFLPTDSVLRQKLERLSLGQLIKLAGQQKVDLKTVDLRNKRRIVRAIEAGGKKPSKKPIRDGTLIVGLKINNQELKKRIEKRADLMIKNGLEQEVRALASRYGWDNEPMKGIGYREWRDYFEGKQTIKRTKERIVSSSLQLAKKQRTWFKRNRSIHWFSSQDRAFGFIKQSLNK